MSLYRREVLSVVGQAFFWVTFRLAKVQKIESHFSSRLGLQWEMPGKLAVHVYHTQQVPVASLRIFHDFGDVPAPLNKVKTNACLLVSYHDHFSFHDDWSKRHLCSWCTRTFMNALFTVLDQSSNQFLDPEAVPHTVHSGQCAIHPIMQRLVALVESLVDLTASGKGIDTHYLQTCATVNSRHVLL